MVATGGRSAGLDSLRFFAILAVMFDHYVKLESFRPGLVSVKFFLLLSGFLITRTLQGHASGHWTHDQGLLKAFFVRRALRIWPLYYALLGALFACGVVSRHEALVHSLFLTNFAQAQANDWNLPWPLAHVWTLCVQEQFYLVWPLLFLWLGARRGPFLALLIGVAVVFRAAMWRMGLSGDVGFYTLPVASLDALAAGSLLAIYREQVSPITSRFKVLFPALGVPCLVIAALPGENFLGVVILPTLWLLPLGLLTLRVFEGALGLAGSFLTWPPAVFLGRISLGIYLLHLPVAYAAYELSPQWLLTALAANMFAPFLLFTAATVLAATGSWLFFEKPLQRLRALVPYDRQTVPANGAVGALAA